MLKKLNMLFLFLLILLFAGYGQQKLTLNDLDRERVLKQAQAFLNESPQTVTDARCERSAGGLHDFYSEGDYWWPNPKDPDGPYIRKDGMTNPDNFTAHRKAMRRLSIQVPALVAAWKLTGDERYAAHALRHLQAWFVNPATRMNPNLLYAQAIKGKVTGRGIGIIDTIHLVEVVQALLVLEKGGMVPVADKDALQRWFADYLHWITTHPYGLKEKHNGNNHSTCWAMQAAQFAKLTGNSAQLDSVRAFYKNELLPGQMDQDGSFPKELKRTKPYGYSLFNLDAMAMVCQIASTPTDDLWTYATDDGRSMQKAVRWMFPYIKDKTSWPFPPDVMYFDDWPVRQPALFFAGLRFKVPAYLETWKTLEADPKKDEVLRNFFIRQPLLWVDNPLQVKL